jgi:hypothetical protein
MGNKKETRKAAVFVSLNSDCSNAVDILLLSLKFNWLLTFRLIVAFNLRHCNIFLHFVWSPRLPL